MAFHEIVDSVESFEKALRKSEKLRKLSPLSRRSR